MSVFSFMKKGRQQAKEHNGKVSESASQESKAAYKHVPTHAGVDALLGAPNSCQGDYKHRILEQHRRRSAIAVSVKSASSAAIPRITSSLSCVTYPSDYNSPPVPSSKVQSSTSFLQTCSQRSPRYDGSENYFSQPTSGKGKQQECIPLVPTLPLAYTSATGAHPHSSIESGKGMLNS